MEITGTLINYYTLCKRKCWLFYNNLRLEDNSEDVKIGKELHKLKERENSEILIDNIKLDKMTKHHLIEYKKSKSNIEGTKFQILYYLYILKNKGIDRIGKIIVIEKTKKNCIEIYLDNNSEKELLKKIDEIEILLNSDVIPKFIENKNCKKCAYYDYCNI